MKHRSEDYEIGMQGGDISTGKWHSGNPECWKLPREVEPKGQKAGKAERNANKKGSD